MAYTILNTDGTTLLLLADGTVDQSATSLALVGRNVNSYGQYLNNDLVKILANSANTSSPVVLSVLIRNDPLRFFAKESITSSYVFPRIVLRREVNRVGNIKQKIKIIHCADCIQ